MESPSSDIIDGISSGAWANRGDASSEGDTSGDRGGGILANEDDVQADVLSNSPQPLAKENRFFSLSAVPAYAGNAYVAMNGNEPYFDTNSLSSESYEIYAELDVLGRCGVAHACIGQDLMPSEERGISVKSSLRAGNLFATITSMGATYITGVI